MPLPPYLLSIYAYTLEGEPMTNPTWCLLGDEEIKAMIFKSSCGSLLLGEQSVGHYLVDPTDIGLDYQTCLAYVTTRDQHASLVSETSLPTNVLVALRQTQCSIRDRTFKTIHSAALNISKAHLIRRYVTLR